MGSKASDSSSPKPMSSEVHTLDEFFGDTGGPAVVRAAVDVRVWRVHDRDINAAKNLCCYALARVS